MSKFTILGLGLSLLASKAIAATVEVWWNISYVENVNPDGLFSRRAIGVNGSWPVPPIVSTQGDTVIVHAYNGLGDDKIGAAVHTHGLFFNETNWADGASAINQCPIPNGQTFDYVIPTTTQTGTFWIHGHYEGQNADGLKAPFIILPANSTGRNDQVTWDEEYTIIMTDWYHDEYPYLVDTEFLHWTNPTGAEPVPKSALIYTMGEDGKYHYSNEDLMKGVGISDASSLNFEPGKKYRIRMINMSSLAMFFVHLDGHETYIIEMDGIEVQPYLIDTITISVAQRYSILVSAQNSTDTNYAMTFIQDTDMYDAVPDDLVLNNTLQIVYNSDNAKAQPSIPDDIEMFDETKVTPDVAVESLNPDVEFTLHAYFDTYSDGTNRASFNNITFQMPNNVPSMYTALTMGEDASNPAVYGAQTNAFTYKHLQVVQATVHNWDAGFHPFHLHGHIFQVVQKSFDVTSNDTSINPPLVEGQANPIRRDTIVIPPGGAVTLRWVADNPGAWMFHCHIDWHLTSGLAVIFIEAPEQFQALNSPIPSQVPDQCSWWGHKTEGNVAGKFSTTDFKGQPYGPFPLKMGWTSKAIGALAGCIITFLLGVATIVWYSMGELGEAEMEQEVKYKMDKKAAHVPFWKKMSSKA